jgi:hypothetical protein
MINLKKLIITIIIFVCFLFDCKAYTKHITCTYLMANDADSFYMCNLPNGDVCYILNNKAISCKFANN